MNEQNIILGIDPGTTIMGFGLIKTTKKEKSFFIITKIRKSISSIKK